MVHGARRLWARYVSLAGDVEDSSRRQRAKLLLAAVPLFEGALFGGAALNLAFGLDQVAVVDVAVAVVALVVIPLIRRGCVETAAGLSGFLATVVVVAGAWGTRPGQDALHALFIVLPLIVGLISGTRVLLFAFPLILALAYDLSDGRFLFEPGSPWSDEDRFAANIHAIALCMTGGLAVIFNQRQKVAIGRALEALDRLEDEVEIRRAAEWSARGAARAKSNLLAVMSHEVRTPLNGILGLAKLLEDETLTSEAQDNLRTLESCGESLLTLLNDILDYSKLDAGKFQVESAPVCVQEVVEGAARLQRGVAEDGGLDLRVVLDPNLPPWVRGDAVRLRQILINLTSNALKFTHDGGVVVTVACAESGVRFEVSDSGIGIAPDKLAHLFDPFVQAEASTSRRYGGTGLGLTICRRLVELMGGAISVESTVGVGSTFSFSLPLEACPAPDPRAEQQRVAEKEFRRPRTLIIDDNVVNLRVAAKLLERHGFEVETAEGAAEGLETFEGGRFELVLMDLQMPEVDGLEATRSLRATERGRAAWIVGLSANARPEDRESALEAGMDDYLTKPFRPPELFAILESFGAAGPET